MKLKLKNDLFSRHIRKLTKLELRSSDKRSNFEDASRSGFSHDEDSHIHPGDNFLRNLQVFE